MAYEFPARVALAHECTTIRYMNVHRRDAAGKFATISLKDRYESHVVKAGKNECWGWEGSTDKKGYGRLYLRKPNGNLTSIPASRLGWILKHGEIGSSKIHVLHTCDNPPCQNPRHWFLGSNADNVADKMRKGRHHSVSGDRHPLRKNPELACHGEEHSHAKLTAEQVREIRASYTGAWGEQSFFARKYGVTRNTIRVMLDGKTWRAEL